MSQTSPTPPPAPTPRQLLLLSVPAVLIGVLSALILSALNQVSGLVERALWDLLPNAAGGRGRLTLVDLPGADPDRRGGRVGGLEDAGSWWAGLGHHRPHRATTAGQHAAEPDPGRDLDPGGWGEPRAGEPDHRHQRGPGHRARRPAPAPGRCGADHGHRSRWHHRRPVRHPGRGGADLHRGDGRRTGRRSAVGQAVPAAGGRRRRLDHHEAAGRADPRLHAPSLRNPASRRPAQRGPDRLRLPADRDAGGAGAAAGPHLLPPPAEPVGLRHSGRSGARRAGGDRWGADAVQGAGADRRAAGRRGRVGDRRPRR